MLFLPALDTVPMAYNAKNTAQWAILEEYSPFFFSKQTVHGVCYIGGLSLYLKTKVKIHILAHVDNLKSPRTLIMHTHKHK